MPVNPKVTIKALGFSCFSIFLFVSLLQNGKKIYFEWVKLIYLYKRQWRIPWSRPSLGPSVLRLLMLTASSTFQAVHSNLFLFPGQNKPLLFPTHKGSQATRAREASEQKWGICSCCPSGPCTDARLKSTHTYYEYTHRNIYCSICFPHTDSKLFEGYNKKRQRFQLKLNNSHSSDFAAWLLTEIKLSNLCFPLRAC